MADGGADGNGVARGEPCAGAVDVEVGRVALYGLYDRAEDDGNEARDELGKDESGAMEAVVEGDGVATGERIGGEVGAALGSSTEAAEVTSVTDCAGGACGWI